MTGVAVGGTGSAKGLTSSNSSTSVSDNSFLLYIRISVMMSAASMSIPATVRIRQFRHSDGPRTITSGGNVPETSRQADTVPINESRPVVSATPAVHRTGTVQVSTANAGECNTTVVGNPTTTAGGLNVDGGDGNTMAVSPTAVCNAAV